MIGKNASRLSLDCCLSHYPHGQKVSAVEKLIVKSKPFPLPQRGASVFTSMSQGCGLSSSGQALMGHGTVGFAVVWHVQN
jgi:hypothetical protein